MVESPTRPWSSLSCFEATPSKYDKSELKIAEDHNVPQNQTKINVNIYKLIDLAVRIQLSRAILMLRLSNCLTNSIIHFRIFLYLESGFLRVAISLLCRLQAVL